jgi:hypothetical protein
MIQENGVWNADQSCGIGNSPQQLKGWGGHCSVLDAIAYTSVKTAVTALKNRELECKPGLCIVKSGTFNSFFLVWRSDKKFEAESLMKQKCQAWSREQSFGLGEKPQKPSLYIVERKCKVLPKERHSSVGAAVDALNNDQVHAAGGLCAVYSAEMNSYFLLYRSDKKDEAAKRKEWTQEVGLDGRWVKGGELVATIKGKKLTWAAPDSNTQEKDVYLAERNSDGTSCTMRLKESQGRNNLMKGTLNTKDGTLKWEDTDVWSRPLASEGARMDCKSKINHLRASYQLIKERLERVEQKCTALELRR